MNASRLAANIAALRSRQSALAARVQASSPRAADDTAETRAALDSFFANLPANRISVGWPKVPDDARLLTQRVWRRGMALIPAPPDPPPAAPLEPDAGALLVFGLGSGAQLTRLMEALPVRSVFVVEEDPAALASVLASLDLQSLYETQRQRGGRLEFVIGETPEMAASYLYFTLRAQEYGLIDGSYIVFLPTNDHVAQTRERFLAKLPHLASAPGFIEDEAAMVVNYVENTVRFPGAVLNAQPRPPHRTPAVIVGSGPSLDGCLDFVAAQRESSVVFSSGTALGPLLKRGIKPDFQVATENTPGTGASIALCAEDHDLSSITLLASNTVHPQASRYFDSRVYFFRDTVCSSALFGADFGEMSYTAPTVSNAAAALAIALGFKDLLLVGVDLGARQGKPHHASSSVYYERLDVLPQADEISAIYNFPYETPGNFGGAVWSNDSFRSAIQNFAFLFERHPSVRVRNLSDGALIPGADPCMPESATMVGSPTLKQSELRRLYDALERPDETVLVPSGRIDGFDRALRTIVGGLDAALASEVGRPPDLWRLYDKIAVLVNGEAADPPDSAARRTVRGAIMTIFTFLHQAYRRLPPGEGRERFYQDYLLEMRAAVSEMADQTADTVARLRALLRDRGLEAHA